MTTRLAGWSGPRNISTAMMRAWDSRPDCSVVDEPFYGCYLSESGAEHPMREAIMAAQSCSRRAVESALSSDQITALQYEKHMTHHMPRGVNLSWTKGVKHVFLIRSPAQIIASYRQKMPSVSEDDIGIVRQRELFDEITTITGSRPPVVDSMDVLNDPERYLRKLCEVLSIDWIPGAMTQWAAGRRASDGIWASHWYGAVEQSVGFAKPKPEAPNLERADAELADALQSHYEAMARFKIV